MGPRLTTTARVIGQRIGVAICLTLALALFGGCDSKPTDADGENALQQHVVQNWGGLMEVAKFNKTDGQSSEANGIKTYRLDFDGELKILKSCTYGETGGTLSAMSGSADTLDPAQGAGGLTAAYPGDVIKIRGHLSFQRTESAWKLTDAKISPTTITRGPNYAPNPSLAIKPAPGPNNIFGLGGSGKPPAPVAPAPPKDTSIFPHDPAPPVRVAPVAPPPPPEPTGPTLEEAQEKYRVARAAVERTLIQLPEYRAARSTADKAAAEVETAKSLSGVGSAELLEASRQSLEAKTKLNKMFDEAAAKSPAYLAAKKELDAVRAHAHLARPGK
jgi:hypothetical protein